MSVESKFEITQELIEGYCQQGLTTGRMAEEITKVSGYKCPLGLVRKAAKEYGINLRAKPKESPFTITKRSNNEVATEGNVSNSGVAENAQAPTFALS